MNKLKKQIMQMVLLVGLIIPATAQSQDYSFSVCLKDGYGKQNIETLLSNHGIGLSESNLVKPAYPNAVTPSLSKYFTVQGSNEIADDVFDILINSNFFEEVELEELIYITNCTNPVSTVNDYWITQNWINNDALELVDYRCAWSLTNGNPNVVIGIADTDFDENHDDLQSQVYQIDGPVSGQHSHGTSVAGVAGASTNNGEGIAGIGYNCKLALERIQHSSSGGAFPSSIKSAIWNLYLDGIPVINVSWTGTGLDAAAAKEITDNGTTLVISAGNTPTGSDHFEIANIPGVIIVSGVDKDGYHVPTGHRHNSYVDLCAQSTKVASTDIANGYKSVWGTSFAAPMVSGTIGLMLSVNNCLSPAQIESILKQTTNPIPDASVYPGGVGTGYLNAYRAVKAAQEMNSTTLDLFTKDRPDDYGKEPNAYHWQADYDESPDIWVRNQQDGLVNQTHESPIFNASSATNLYVYVRVWNKSCQTSNGTEELDLYWSKSSGWASWPNNWNGSDPTVGNKIGTVTLPVMGPGESTVVEIPWVPISPMIFDNWNTCLLTQLTNINGDGITFYPGRQDKDVRKNNNVSMRNVTFLQGPESPKEGVLQGFKVPMGTFMYIGNPTENEHNLDIRFMEEDINNGLSIFSQAEVKLYFEQNDWEFISSYFEGNESFTVLAPQEVLINNGNAELTNIAFGTEHRIPMYVGVHFLTEEPTTDNEFKLHVREYLSEEQSLVGGEHFTIFKNDRIAFDAEAGLNVEIRKNESTTLNASNINENAVYNWYNSSGDLIYTGTDLTISPEVSETYKLEVIADADGFKDYDEVEVTVKEFYINAISPNPASTTMTVDYKTSETDNGYVRVMNSLGTVNNNYIIIANSSNQTIDVSSFQTGNYSVSLIINGVIADTKQVIIQ